MARWWRKGAPARYLGDVIRYEMHEMRGAPVRLGFGALMTLDKSAGRADRVA